MEAIVAPKIEVIESTARYGRFVAQALEQGMGTTIGNALRRVLLSSLTGAAVTWVRIEGVQHEHSSIPHVKEDVIDFLLNVKALRLRPLSDRPTRLRLEVSGEGQVSAGDITPSADVEVVNPELHLATLDSPEAKLSVEFNVERGKGYMEATHSDGLPIGVLPVDAIFTPVQKVNYTVERIRVGQESNLERLGLEVWTDGTITPEEAIRKSSQILMEHFFHFSNLGKAKELGAERHLLGLSLPAEQYNTPIEVLKLSARTLNCLKRNNINKVGEVLERSKKEFLSLRNFGEKSLTELYARLGEAGFLPPESNLGEDEEPTEVEQKEQE